MEVTEWMAKGKAEDLRSVPFTMIRPQVSPYQPESNTSSVLVARRARYFFTFIMMYDEVPFQGGRNRSIICRSRASGSGRPVPEEIEARMEQERAKQSIQLLPTIVTR